MQVSGYLFWIVELLKAALDSWRVRMKICDSRSIFYTPDRSKVFMAVDSLYSWQIKGIGCKLKRFFHRLFPFSLTNQKSPILLLDIIKEKRVKKRSTLMSRVHIEVTGQHFHLYHLFAIGETYHNYECCMPIIILYALPIITPIIIITVSFSYLTLT